MMHELDIRPDSGKNISRRLCLTGNSERLDYLLKPRLPQVIDDLIHHPILNLYSPELRCETARIVIDEMLPDIVSLMEKGGAIQPNGGIIAGSFSELINKFRLSNRAANITQKSGLITNGRDFNGIIPKDMSIPSRNVRFFAK